MDYPDIGILDGQSQKVDEIQAVHKFAGPAPTS
ncbi:MAG: hypothetical protein Ct9H300mP11_17330 [Chloroflexota bacterium]|nr:MAG: hypothetical protein Ct9H300mP11_17330 [Chloroflexota bacterium]